MALSKRSREQWFRIPFYGQWTCGTAGSGISRVGAWSFMTMKKTRSRCLSSKTQRGAGKAARLHRPLSRIIRNMRPPPESMPCVVAVCMSPCQHETEDEFAIRSHCGFASLVLELRALRRTRRAVRSLCGRVWPVLTKRSYINDVRSG